MRLVSLMVVLPLAVLPAQAPGVSTARVLADIGGATDDPASEMLRVGGVIRRPDGRFLVGNGDPIEVRVYDAKGQVLRRFGHEGAGPGEFGSAPRVFPWPGDSVLTYSSSGARWMLFTLDGHLVREWGALAPQRPSTAVVLRGSALMSRGIVGAMGCPVGVLDRLAPREAVRFSQAMTDESGRLWIRPAGGDQPWAVHAPNGRQIAAIRLPPGFVPMQFTGEQVVGVRRDDDGFPHAMAIATGLPTMPRSEAAPCADAVLPVAPVRAAMLKTGLRNAMTFAEAFHTDHGRYPARAGDYPSGVKPDDTEFLVLDGGRDTFILSVVDRPTGWRCIVSVGAGATGELPDGYLVCG